MTFGVALAISFVPLSTAVAVLDAAIQLRLDRATFLDRRVKPSHDQEN
jgi:hypothetical protein